MGQNETVNPQRPVGFDEVRRRSKGCDGSWIATILAKVIQLPSPMDYRRSTGTHRVYTEINNSLASIAGKLFRNSLNYSADFRLFVSKETAGEAIETVVKAILGDNAVIAKSKVATRKEVIDELRDALRYRGDHGSHPSLDYLDSRECRADFDKVVSAIQRILDDSICDIQSFSLKEGHPFYPVFWDFAFLIQTSDESILFIASSSD